VEGRSSREVTFGVWWEDIVAALRQVVRVDVARVVRLSAGGRGLVIVAARGIVALVRVVSIGWVECGVDDGSDVGG